ncbi:hypothetical protein BC628DRAFT_1395979 [Trametes gibbosa]|nr:hypothetical protein BC628DRAFT_1395979 [Trametes gibbosa]
MDSVTIALKAVDNAVAKKKPMDRKRLVEIAGHVSSHLVLLKLQSLSKAIAGKLSSFLRESLAILYTGVGFPALRLTSSLFQSVYYERLLPTIGNMQKDQQNLWESVLHALLAGVLDYLDAQDSTEAKDAIGEALYPSLCEICLSLTAPKTSSDLRCTAYNILCDSAASHPPNQQKLRDTNILGGERLGSCIWRTRDYLAIEGLLNVFARTIPSTHNSPSGRSKRTAYIDSVFRSCTLPEAIAAGSKIAELLANVPTSNWEETALKIVDILANGNISFPQPFPVTRVVACDNPYSSDRLYVDDKGLLINVLLSDDQYESIEVKYSTIQDVNISPISQRSFEVAVSMDELPCLGKNRLSARTINDNDTSLGISFVLQERYVHKFLEALKARGLVYSIPEIFPLLTLPKSSLAIKPAYLELNDAGSLANDLSQTERIENVSQFYKTDDPSDDITSCGDSPECQEVVNASPGPMDPNLNRPVSPPSQPAVSIPMANLLPEGRKVDVADEAYENDLGTGNTRALSRAGSHLVRAAVFGYSDEELSEISDSDSPLSQPRILRRSSTSTRLVRGQISFEPLPATSTGTSSSATRVARGGIGKVILDSDDDSPPVAPILSDPRRAKRTAALMRDPTVDESQELLPLVPVPILAPASATIPAASATPSPLLGDITFVSSSGREKVLRFSDIPAPNFHAALSSPAFVPKSALKSVLLKAPDSARLGNLPDPETATLSSVSVPASVANTRSVKAPAVKASDLLNDLAPPSSSPTPGTRKTIKAKLRKKEFQDRDRRIHDKTSTKRKADVAFESPSTSHNDALGRSTKRARPLAASSMRTLSTIEDVECQPGVVNDRLDTEVFRPHTVGTPRATKKYRAKKGRASSTIVENSDSPLKKVHSVDYDALPSPPRPHGALTVMAPSPAPKAKAKRVPKPKAKAKTTAKTEIVAQHAIELSMQMGPQDQVNGSGDLLSIRNARGPRLNGAPQEQTEICAEETDRPMALAAECPSPAALTACPPRQEEIENVLTKQVELNRTKPAGLMTTWNPDFGGNHRERTSRKATYAKLKISSKTPWDITIESASDLRKEEIVTTELVTVQEAVNDARITDIDASLLQHSTPRRGVRTPDRATHSEPEVNGRANEDGSARYVLEEHTAPDPSRTIVQPDLPSEGRRILSTASKFAPIPPLIVANQETETIDLTLDSPPRHTQRVPDSTFERTQTMSRPPIPLPAVLNDTKCKITTRTGDCDDIATFLNQEGNGRLGAKEGALRHRRATNLEYEDLPQFVSDQHGGESGHKRVDRTYEIAMEVPIIQAVRREARATKTVRNDMDLFETKLSTDTATDRIIDMLGRFHEVIVHNIENKFEGLRQEARLSRNQLLRSAATDLESMHADSVAQFNKLVDLEAEYATTGRSLIHHSEDWVKTNQELSGGLTHSLELHDRMMMSKKMPAGLITVTF